MESGEEGGSEGMEDMADADSEGGMEDSEPAFDEGTAGEEVAGGSSGAEDEALPDFSEDESLEEALEEFEKAMEEAAADASQGGNPGGGMPAGTEGEQGAQGAEGEQSAGGGPPGGGHQGEGDASGSAGAQQGGYGAAGGAGGIYEGGQQGSSGPLTGAEQVAILDAELNRGTGDFDDLILRERETIRRTTTNAPGNGEEPETGAGGGGGYGGGYSGGDYTIPPMAGTGSGQGGPGPVPRSGKYDGDIPAQTAVYPAPANIPSGNDDDVVSRQLREAAMREPDPKLREKLWDEYRKYKGIE